MNYTTNYHLPQWVESDRILMEDFNDAMEAIDEGLSTKFSEDNRPYVSGNFSISMSTNVGTVPVTFDFEPHHVILSKGCALLIRQGTTEMLYTDIANGPSVTEYLTFALSGNQLKFNARGSGISGTITISYIAYR